MARPIFDPALPDEVRVRLTRATGELSPASGPDPATLRRAQARRELTNLGVSLGLFALAAASAASGKSLDSRALLLSGLALFVAAAVVAGRAGVRLVELLLPGDADRRLARRCHGRYLLEEDFRGGSGAAYRSITESVDLVLNSAVFRAGLLDPVRTRYFLSCQEWDLARELLALDQADQAARGSSAPDHPPARFEQVRRERAALLERVRALRSYAQRVADVDRTYVRQLDQPLGGDAVGTATGSVLESQLAELASELDSVRRVLAEPGE
jgi:hypothetical protein